MRHITPRLCAQLSCFFLFLVFNPTSAAQYRPGPGIRSDIPNREWTLANLRKENMQPSISVEREARLLLMTVKEDFRQLQIVNNELMERTFNQSRNNPSITSKDIRSSLGEIQRRAERLRTNLHLPEVKTRKDDVTEDGLPARTMSSGLVKLDQTIMKFVENPVFQQPGVLDAHHSLRAADDLNKILQLTDSLHKLAKENSRITEPFAKGLHARE